MAKLRNPVSAIIDYLLGDDDQDVPPLPEELSGDLAAAIDLHLRRLVEFQNTDYALLYLDRLGRFRNRFMVTDAMFAEIADLLAQRMAFNDPIRVAQIVLGRAPSGPPAAALALPDGLYRPEVQEVAAILPVEQAIKLRNGLRRARMLMGRFRIRPAIFSGRIRLKALVRFRRMRPMSLRHVAEHAAIERWLHMIDRALTKAPDTAWEIVRSAAIVKGWGANYRLALLNWHFMIDQLAKPVFDSKLAVPNLALFLAEARDSLAVDQSGETMRAIVASARAVATAEPQGAA